MYKDYKFSFVLHIKYVFSGADNLVIDDGESVSPPSTPLSSGVRLIMPELDNNREDDDEEENQRPSNSRGKVSMIKYIRLTFKFDSFSMKATKKIDEILEGIFNPQKYEPKLLSLFNPKYKLSPA
jgi:hypothetical protein